MPLSSEPDPYSMQHYHTKFQVMLGRQPHNARQVIKHASRIGHFQDMYRVPLKKNKIEEIRKKTGYVEHGGQLVKKSYATKVRKEAARELRRRQGKPIVGSLYSNEATQKLKSIVSSSDVHGAANIVRQLLDAGADPSTKTTWTDDEDDEDEEDHMPVVVVATAKEAWDVVMLLLDRGANVHVVAEGDTLLHIAATIESVRPNIVKKMVAKGVNIDALDNTGSTALERAVVFGVATAVDALLRAGANPRLVNLGRIRKARSVPADVFDRLVSTIRTAQLAYS